MGFTSIDQNLYMFGGQSRDDIFGGGGSVLVWNLWIAHFCRELFYYCILKFSQRQRIYLSFTKWDIASYSEYLGSPAHHSTLDLSSFIPHISAVWFVICFVYFTVYLLPMFAHDTVVSVISWPCWIFAEMKYFSDLFAFNTVSHTWSQLTISGESPSPRCAMGFSRSFTKNLYLFGGLYEEGERFCEPFFCFT